MSYETLRELLRKEMKSGALAPIPKDFYDKVSEFIAGLKEERLRENTLKTVEQICERRMAKLLMRAAQGSGGKPSDLPEVEESFFNDVDGSVRRFKERVQAIFVGGASAGAAERAEKMEPRKEERRGSQLRMLQDVPQFVAPDGSVYGPFKKGDVAWLPEDVANLLVKRKVAEGFEHWIK